MIKNITILALSAILFAQLNSNSAEKKDYIKNELELELSAKIVELKELAKMKVEWKHLGTYADSTNARIQRNIKLDVIVNTLREVNDTIKHKSNELWSFQENFYGVIDSITNKVQLYENIDENWKVSVKVNNEKERDLNTSGQLIVCDLDKENILDVSLLFIRSGERFRKLVNLGNYENCKK